MGVVSGVGDEEMGAKAPHAGQNFASPMSFPQELQIAIK